MSKLDKSMESLAAWDLERHKDFYPAGALDKDSCFYNGQIGNCGLKCLCYISGNCTIADEITEE